MPSKTYVFPVEKPERFFGLTESEHAFFRKEMYFRFRELFSCEEAEAQQFKKIANMIRAARKYSANSVRTKLTATFERPHELILIVEFSFPDFGKLLGFDSLLEQNY